MNVSKNNRGMVLFVRFVRLLAVQARKIGRMTSTTELVLHSTLRFCNSSEVTIWIDIVPQSQISRCSGSKEELCVSREARGDIFLSLITVKLVFILQKSKLLDLGTIQGWEENPIFQRIGRSLCFTLWCSLFFRLFQIIYRCQCSYPVTGSDPTLTNKFFPYLWLSSHRDRKGQWRTLGRVRGVYRSCGRVTASNMPVVGGEGTTPHVRRFDFLLIFNRLLFCFW